jgi:hypothetical protein
MFRKQHLIYVSGQAGSMFLTYDRENEARDKERGPEQRIMDL